MSENNFSVEEIDILFNALELWENETIEAGAVARTVMASMWGGEKIDVEGKMQNLERESRAEKRMRKEQSAYLKVKLLSLRDKQVVKAGVDDIFKEVVNKESSGSGNS
jgi:hypothetical protein